MKLLNKMDLDKQHLPSKPDISLGSQHKMTTRENLLTMLTLSEATSEKLQDVTNLRAQGHMPTAHVPTIAIQQAWQKEENRFA